MSVELKDAYQRLVEAKGRSTKIEVGTIAARDYQKFAYAVGHLDERFLIPPGGVTSLGQLAEAPPTYLSAVMEWSAGPEESRLRSDGSQPDVTGGLPMEGLRLMGAGQDLEFHTPLTDGMTIFMNVSILDVTFKEGRSGALILLTVLKEYLDDQSRPVVTCRETIIAR